MSNIACFIIGAIFGVVLVIIIACCSVASISSRLVDFTEAKEIRKGREVFE